MEVMKKMERFRSVSGARCSHFFETKKDCTKKIDTLPIFRPDSALFLFIFCRFCQLACSLVKRSQIS